MRKNACPRNKLLCVSLCLVCMTGFMPHTASALNVYPERGGAIPQVSARPLTGRLLASDLKTPCPDVQLRIIRNETQDTLLEATSDSKGAFRTRALPEGRYTILGDGISLAQFDVTAESEISELNIILPQSIIDQLGITPLPKLKPVTSSSRVIPGVAPGVYYWVLGGLALAAIGAAFTLSASTGDGADDGEPATVVLP